MTIKKQALLMLAATAAQLTLPHPASAQQEPQPTTFVGLRYSYEPNGLGAHQPTSRGAAALLAIDPVATTLPTDEDGFDAAVQNLQVTNQATLNLRSSTSTATLCWRVRIRGHSRSEGNGVGSPIYIIRRSGRGARTREFVDFSRPGTSTVELLTLQRLPRGVELAIREYAVGCNSVTEQTQPTTETTVSIAAISESERASGFSSEIKGFPLAVNNFLRLVCDFDGGRYYYQAFDRGIISPRTNAACELVFDPWIDTDFLTRSPVPLNQRQQLYWSTEPGATQHSTSNQHRDLLLLAGPQQIAVQVQSGSTPATTREWRVSTVAVANADSALPWQRLPRYPLPRQNGADSAELIVTASTDAALETAPAPSSPGFRAVVRPTGTVFLGGQNRWGNGVRVVATVAVAPLSVRLPAARSDLLTSSSFPAIQIVAPRLSTNIVVEPWNFRQRENAFAPYLPVRFIFGFNWFETSNQVFAPSTLVGVGIAFPILASESVSALTASLSVNVLWEHDIREPQGNYALVTTSLDLLSLLSPQSTPARTNTATNAP